MLEVRITGETSNSGLTGSMVKLCLAAARIEPASGANSAKSP